jgi:acyl-CoA reductase-like NAD-dependent aldehyde dehydrogenase
MIELSAIAAWLEQARAAQRDWAALPVRARLARLRRLRHAIAADGATLARAVGIRPGRSLADTIACELMPLADAARFLERRADRLLAPRRLGRRGRPWWLLGAAAELRREPLGLVLVIGPGNYPLFIPGVQLLQGLAAGNAVALKPGAGGHAALAALVDLAAQSGIPRALLPLLPEAPAAAAAAIAAGVDKVILTGSAETGAAVLAALAPALTPAVMELSGNDAVIVLPGADLDLVADAIAYGLRLNGGATCIAPRRVFVPTAEQASLAGRLETRLAGIPPVPLDPAVVERLSALLSAAVAGGARLLRGALPPTRSSGPLLLADADPATLREGVFAPLACLVPVASTEQALAMAALSPYALGAAVFGPEAEARRVAGALRAGLVTINDVIVPSADPRLPFGGRGRSGFGVTRGAEGLLEMTAVKAVSVRRGRLRPHFRPLREADAPLFLAALAATHAGGAVRLRAAAGLVRAAAGRGRRSKAASAAAAPP